MAQLAPKATWPDAISTDFSTLLPNGRLGWHVWEQHRTAWNTTRLSMPRLMNWRRNWRQPSIATRCSLLRTKPHERRSEEHTSELQSLNRSSYAVFCLKEQQEVPAHETDRIRRQHPI